jgi:hypothetical protein
MGLVNRVVPLDRLEPETIAWCRDILANSPLALRCLKAAFNADTDGWPACRSWPARDAALPPERGREGRDAFLEKRAPDFALPRCRDPCRGLIAAVRPRTPAAAVAPVAVGTAVAARTGQARPAVAVAALAGALLLRSARTR